MPMNITVNGCPHAVQAEPETPLLYVLRNELQLKGTRFGCGLGQCGACTVMVDGIAVQSCDVPVSAVAGKEILTVEGLARDGRLDALQEAFIAEQAAQCGYCASGIIMAARALLNANPRPTDAQVREALAGNLCRCGTHSRILRAIRRAIDAGSRKEATA